VPKPLTTFQESFKIPMHTASLRTKTPPKYLLQVTDGLGDGKLVPVRRYDKECSPEIVEFVGIAA
jgi:hypothetical protein